MSIGYGPRIVTDGLVYYYDAASPRSYPGSGTVWTDIISASTATLTGATYSSTFGGGIAFSGVGQYADTNISAWPGNFTLEAWFTPNNLPNKQAITSSYPGTGSDGAGLEISGSLFNFFIMYVGGSYTAITTGTPTIGSPVCMHCTLSGTAMAMYRNSQVLATATLGGASIRQSGSITIGAEQNHTNPFNGTVYAIKIYNRGLNATEINQNFNTFRGRYGI